MKKIKTKKETRTAEEKISIMKVIILFLGTFCLLFLVYMVTQTNPRTVHRPNFYNDQIDFNENISLHDRQIITKTIDNIDPYYLDTIKTFYIILNKSILENHVGYHQGQNIYLVWNNSADFNLTLNHEICHSFSDDDKFCSDIMWGEPFFKNA